MNDPKQEQFLDHPILIPSPPKARPCHNWTFSSLCQILKSKQLTCRVWKKSVCQVLETECDHVDVSMKEFWDWLQTRADNKNPLHCYERSSHAGYIDYKYMRDVFNDCPHTLQEVQWADFGLPDFDGKDSTIWIGSEGSNTSGHQDSYGFNLVTQIQGRKMWILFPPGDTQYLYPTRIPYEESSVFSQVHLGCPNIDEYPNIKAAHPIVVVLHPGQTMYVPHHWWHYVESLDPSISINVWIPHRDDDHCHVTESVTRCLATSLLNDIKSKGHNALYNKLLNPTETLCETSTNVHFLKCAIDKVLGLSLSNNGQYPMDSVTDEGEKSQQDDCSTSIIEGEKSQQDDCSTNIIEGEKSQQDDCSTSIIEGEKSQQDDCSTSIIEGEKSQQDDCSTSIIEEDVACDKKAKQCDFLDSFACWLKSCNMIQAPTSPCLGYVECCEFTKEGCILPRTDPLKDVDWNRKEYVQRGAGCRDDCSTGKRFISQKRTHEDGECNLNVKRCKQDKEMYASNSINLNLKHSLKTSKLVGSGNLFGDNEPDSTLESKSMGKKSEEETRELYLYSKAIIDKNVTESNPFVSEEDWGDERNNVDDEDSAEMSSEHLINPSSSSCFAKVKNTDTSDWRCTAFSLVTPFSFDHYVQLMKLKDAASGISKVDYFPCGRLECSEKEKVQSIEINASTLCKVKKSSSIISSSMLKQNILDSSCDLHLTASLTPSSSSACPCSSSALSQDLLTFAKLDNSDLKITPWSQPVMDNQAWLSQSQNGNQKDTDQFKTGPPIPIPSNIHSSNPCEEIDNYTQCEKASSESGAGSITPSLSAACSLTDTEVQRILLDSILHPSIVEQISSLMKTKCTHLLKVKMTESRDDVNDRK